MMIVAAALFHNSGLTGVDSIDGAYDGLKTLVSDRAAMVFGIALLASGFASSSVGTMAGQVVMQGFIRRRIPLFLRRADHAGAGAARAGDRPRPDRRPGRQPGRPLLRHPLRAGAAADDRPPRAR